MITIGHFHGLASAWCKKAGIPFFIPDQISDIDAFWRTEASELFSKAIQKADQKFDAIIVDEGQDFRREWWQTLSLLLQDETDGHFFIFYDPLQNLYLGQDLFIPISDNFSLKKNCRNTRKIARKCGQIIKADIQVREKAAEGADCLDFIIESDDAQRQKCRQILRTWARDYNFRPSQIAILSPDKRQNKILIKETKQDGFLLTDDLKIWRENGGYYLNTIRSFKGLEADAVILYDIDPNKDLSYFSQSDLYVACSRAKLLLAVISRG